MPDHADREALRANYTRRLQKLEQRRALLGYAADPSIDIEIEEIQMHLRTLESQDASDASQVAEHDAAAASSQPPNRQDGSTHISAIFHEKVENVHAGSGDINVYGSQQPSEIVPQRLIGLLRRGVRDHAPPNLAEAARIQVNSLENAIRRHDADDAEDALGWLLRRVPALAGPIDELRQHLSDWRV
jgi:hypothetical protein